MRTTAHESPERLEDELASLAAHINAATARWIELVWAFCEHGGPADGDVARWLAFRCGIATREAREVVRVAEALRELPAIRRAFAGGTLTFTKVRALTRVATATSEEGLLELASALTAPQLERALRAFRRLRSEDAGDSHALEYVDYHWGEDGSLFLRARVPAEDGTLLVRALEAARERVRERRRGYDETATSGDRDPSEEDAARSFEPPRSVQVEALVEVAQASLSSGDRSPGLAQLVVHVDALALAAGGDGRSELEDGPVVSPETALRLGCDAEILASVERHGLPVSSGRRRRTVPAAMRRLLEARDDRTCRWPGCENRRRLQAHHRRHWAHGGETSLDNLVLLCWHHHRLVHEGGYGIEDGPSGELRFRNRYGVLCPSVTRSPPGNVEDLVAQDVRLGLAIDARTNRNGDGDPLDFELALAALERASCPEEARRAA